MTLVGGWRPGGAPSLGGALQAGMVLAPLPPEKLRASASGRRNLRSLIAPTAPRRAFRGGQARDAFSETPVQISIFHAGIDSGAATVV